MWLTLDQMKRVEQWGRASSQVSACHGEEDSELLAAVGESIKIARAMEGALQKEDDDGFQNRLQ